MQATASDPAPKRAQGPHTSMVRFPHLWGKPSPCQHHSSVITCVQRQCTVHRVPSAARQACESAEVPYREGLHTARHALLNVLPLFMVCNVSDVATECDTEHSRRFKPERLLVYDAHPDGLGLSAKVGPSCQHCTALLSNAWPLPIRGRATGVAVKQTQAFVVSRSLMRRWCMVEQRYNASPHRPVTGRWRARTPLWRACAHRVPVACCCMFEAVSSQPQRYFPSRGLSGMFSTKVRFVPTQIAQTGSKTGPAFN
jgi:hypothetical protein